MKYLFDVRISREISETRKSLLKKQGVCSRESLSGFLHLEPILFRFPSTFVYRNFPAAIPGKHSCKLSRKDSLLCEIIRIGREKKPGDIISGKCVKNKSLDRLMLELSRVLWEYRGCGGGVRGGGREHGRRERGK